MEFLHKYGVERQADGVILTLYVSDFDTEFANELGTEITSSHQDSVCEYATKRFPHLKIKAVKIVCGGMMIGMCAFTALAQPKSTVKAAEPTQTLQTTLSYTVKSGDSLSGIAKKYRITASELKSYNTLSTDLIKVGQVLKIPLSHYLVKANDSLSGIAKQFATSVEQLKQLNQLTSDKIYLGQTLVVPAKSSTTNLSSPNSANSPKTYTVLQGDSLSLIAKKHQITVEQLKKMNHLQTDTIKVGQVLTISNQAPSVQQPATTYTVTSGDSLSVIAKKFQTSVENIKKANALSNNIIYTGQSLTIPNTVTQNDVEPVRTENSSATYQVVHGDTLSGIAKKLGLSVSSIKALNNLTSETIYAGQSLKVKQQPATIKYTVKSGDSLSVIAKKFGTTTSDIMNKNGLTSTTIKVGQVLTINSTASPAPNIVENHVQESKNTISYRTHTVKSGDNIWNLSVKYGIPQAELLRENGLKTTSTLSIGQKLKVPVHNIAVQKTVSERHGEYLSWWTEAQYVFPIGKIATVTDIQTGKTFKVKRTIGANHADSETLSTKDTSIAKSIWGGFSWSTRAVIVEVDGRKIAASMSFYPHDVEYIKNNGITGHFDIHFKDSTRHKDGAIDPHHQAKIKSAAGIQ